jgi:hypothetical protein
MSPSDEQPFSDDSRQPDQPLLLISTQFKRAGLKWLPILRRDMEPGDIMFQGVSNEDDSSLTSGNHEATE